MMDESFPLDNDPDMTNHQKNCSHTTVENSKSPVVTTAEVSSEESTKAESPEQPQAITMTTQAKASLSTVHVQQSFHGICTSIPVHTSEPSHQNARKTLVRSAAVTCVPSPPPPQYTDEAAEGTPPYKNTSFDSIDSGIAGELPPRLESLVRASKQHSLSRDGSFEYTDSTGTDLHDFIIKTLKNPRDRKFLMKLEQDFLNFIREPLMFLHYPPMTSYHRMIVHRVAAYFGMDHNVDQQTGKSVIINKTMNTRIPESRFLELIPREESEDLEGAVPRLILKRQNTPSDDSTPPKIDSPVLIHSMEDKRSKSIEEREEEYHKARERIFNQDSISSQSSQSSKGDGDLPPTPQLLQREDGDDVESDLTSAGEMPERKLISKLGKSKSEETEVAEDRTIPSSTGIRIMTNKPFHRSASSPGISSMSGSSAFELVPNPTRRSSAGSQRINARHVPSSQTVLSQLPYWVAEGVPFVAHNLPSGEVQMVPVQNATPPGVQSMVPVMATPSATASPQTAGVMWPVPQEPMQHGVILINPNTGTPMVGADGNPVVMQPAYQQVMVKSGPTAGFTQASTARSAAIQSAQQTSAVAQPQQPQQQSQQQQQGSGQIVIPQYIGLQQPVYVMPSSNRAPYTQQQAGGENAPGSQWAGSGQSVSSGNSGYHEIATQFGGMSLSGQQSTLETASYQQQQYADSVVPSSTRTTPPMYANSITQAGVSGQVQYVVLPSHSGVSQMRPVLQGQGYSGQAVPQAASPQKFQSYVVSPTHAGYQQFPYGTIPKDVTPVIQQHSRSQTPPTPPQTASPALANQFMQQPQAQLTFSSQMPQQSSQQSHAAASYQQQVSAPHSSQQVMRPMVPVVIQGSRSVAMAPGVGQQGTIPSQYQHGPVHVQTQFPSGQRRFYNVDRRVAKAPEMYGSDASAVLHGSPVVHYVDGTVPTGYEIPGERAQNNQHQFARFGSSGQALNSTAAQLQPYNKQKTKQFKERRGSPRGQHQDTGKKHGRKTPESERTAGEQ